MQMWRLLTKMRNGKKYSLRSEATREEPATVAANIILTSRQLCERTELRRAPVEDVIALTCFHQASLCPSLCLGFKRTGYKTDDVRTKVKLSLNASKAWKPKVALRASISMQDLQKCCSCQHSWPKQKAYSLGQERQWHDYPQLSALDRDGNVQHVLISELHIHSKPLGLLSPATKLFVFALQDRDLTSSPMEMHLLIA
ncbi:uncharacterized protein LOC121070315 isoform X1 [Cygnus olor]|uniref:uncharacterized protein LOC121070315 isoform X1 n=1 Tax=Cygnus olor TaxID=8869 RepID=UPI001ADE3273|nr:uncharacterized protein LOC121070315 isoform X1 [Cygnus olor]